MMTALSNKPMPEKWRGKPRRAKRQRVTIAAGFKFDQGILFCADTKITTDIETDERKISVKRYPSNNCTTVFAFAGCVPYARMAVRRCEEAIAQLEDVVGISMSLDSVEVNIESCLVDFYQTHIYQHPHWESEGLDPELLIGIWLKGELRFLSAVETTLNLVSDYECCGSGAYLARYWVRQFYDAFKYHRTAPYLPSAAQAALIANFALTSAMEYDEACGGKAEFQVLGRDGLAGPPDIGSTFERFPPQLLAAMWRMLSKLVGARHRGFVYDLSINEFLNEVRALTSEFDLLINSSYSLAERVSPSSSPSASPSSGGDDDDPDT